jgi:tRNA (guanine37-N1)-methyltransferase
MRIDVLTLFPEIIESYASTSILGIAREKKLFELNSHNFRDFSSDKHKCVDDVIYGGGAGMLLKCQPIFDCLDSIYNQLDKSTSTLIVTSPSGQKFDQKLAKELSQKQNLIFVCGRYEGLDQRIVDQADLNISIGDYVLTGGELAALTIIDASVRLIPGVLGDAQSLEQESFSEIDILALMEKYQVSKKELQEFLDRTGLKSKEDLKNVKFIEYPQYTRPAEFRGTRIPSVLESGDHKKIFLWRLEQSIKSNALI